MKVLGYRAIHWNCIVILSYSCHGRVVQPARKTERQCSDSISISDTNCNAISVNYLGISCSYESEQQIKDKPFQTSSLCDDCRGQNKLIMLPLFLQDFQASMCQVKCSLDTSLQNGIERAINNISITCAQFNLKIMQLHTFLQMCLSHSSNRLKFLFPVRQIAFRQ